MFTTLYCLLTYMRYLSCRNWWLAHKLFVSFSHTVCQLHLFNCQFIIVDLFLLTKLLPISPDLMTKSFWWSSSFSVPNGGSGFFYCFFFLMWAFLLCLLRIRDVSVSLAAIPEPLAAVFIWLWGQYAEGFADKKERPSAKCFGLKRKHKLWCMGILCVGRNTLACGWTEFAYEQLRQDIHNEGAHVCVCVWLAYVWECVCLLGGQLYII